MKKKIIYACFLYIGLFIAQACKDEKIGPLEGNSTPPGQVSNVAVQNLAGKVKVTYTLPKDQDLLYIKAVYEIRPGVTREVKSSYYANSMELDGFADTEEREVKIFAYNRSEVASEPVVVIVKPLENPIWAIYRSLKILPDFAGVRITAENPQKASISLEILKKDSLGNWEPFLPFIYSSQAQISQTTRGLDTLKQEFGVTIRDKFLNYTDTIYSTISPLYEEGLSKDLFKELHLEGDAKIQTVTKGISLLWDGNNNNFGPRMITDVADQNPQYITIDMGQMAKLSRIKMWNYSEWMSNGKHQFYYNGQLRHFEVWGSTTANPDWSTWTLLGTFENIKPSGAAYGTTTTEDWDAAIAGFDYDIDPNAGKVRYLRIKCLQNWKGSTWFEILELNVYGDTR